jgi:DNA-binding NarL/FixJ family response regulator
MSSFKIVIVEDNYADSEILSDLFLMQGKNIDIKIIEYFKDAEIFINSLPININIFILDINLKDGNGLDLLSLIKSKDELKHIPVVMYSSNNSSNNVFKSYQLHANSFIVKSFLNAEKLTEYWTNIAETVNYPIL